MQQAQALPADMEVWALGPGEPSGWRSSWGLPLPMANGTRCAAHAGWLGRCPGLQALHAAQRPHGTQTRNPGQARPRAEVAQLARCSR